MNGLVEKNIITELECGSNFSYILSDNKMFSSTEYKVLQSQSDSCFVKCMKMLHNGKVQLYYLTKDLKSFASIIPSLEPENLLTIVSGLLSDIINVKNNGFLSCSNIDIYFEHIFVDPATYRVSLIYLPLNQCIYEDDLSFENEFRAELIRLISSVPSLSDVKTKQLVEHLSNGTLSIEDLLERIKKVKTTPTVYRNVPSLHIVGVNTPVRVDVEVTKDSFVIGKRPDLCDGIIDFNRMISRSHCRINRNGNQYTITDLQSVNGTYVNKIKLIPNVPQSIKNGDMIRLANSDFQIIIE